MASKSAKRSNSNRARAQSTGPDAIELLRADHAKVQKLFKQFEKTEDDDRKQELAKSICSELTVHATIEEEILYPAAREALDDEDLLDEAEVEHASAKDLIAQIEAGSSEDDKWAAKVTVLGEYINHHVEEEQNEMFPKLKKSDLDLSALGEQLQARKEELMAEPARKGRRTNSNRGMHLQP